MNNSAIADKDKHTFISFYFYPSITEKLLKKALLTFPKIEARQDLQRRLRGNNALQKVATFRRRFAMGKVEQNSLYDIMTAIFITAQKYVSSVGLYILNMNFSILNPKLALAYAENILIYMMQIIVDIKMKVKFGLKT